MAQEALVRLATAVFFLIAGSSRPLRRPLNGVSPMSSRKSKMVFAFDELGCRAEDVIDSHLSASNAIA
jgi:hypothetical protein